MATMGTRVGRASYALGVLASMGRLEGGPVGEAITEVAIQLNAVLSDGSNTDALDSALSNLEFQLQQMNMRSTTEKG